MLGVSFSSRAKASFLKGINNMTYTVQKFLEYVKYPTMSDESSESCPSSAKQLILGAKIVEDLKELGLDDARMDEHGYVYATLPSNTDKKVPTIGLVAHMDTSDAASDSPINARIVHFDGSDVILSEDENGKTVLSANDYPSLEKYVGDDLIVTDGKTLLGADDKAGIAEILGAVKYIKENNVIHGTIKIGFTPDEEIGRGADLFDIEGFGADYAYTVDGGACGEIEYENFNAASAVAKFSGISIHPGSAKNQMVNAALLAVEFASLLPADKTPANTEGYEGFFHLCDISGSCENAEVSYIIRDHDRAKLEEMKALFLACGEFMAAKYGKKFVEVSVKDSYYNMKEKILPHIEIVERAEAAMRECGIEPIIVPIRGGTDGARLSWAGLPCPNLCTGGENFHGRFEYISVQSMERITSFLVKLLENAAK